MTASLPGLLEGCDLLSWALTFLAIAVGAGALASSNPDEAWATMARMIFWMGLGIVVLFALLEHVALGALV